MKNIVLNTQRCAGVKLKNQKYCRFLSELVRGRDLGGPDQPIWLSSSLKEYRKNWARLIRKIGACPVADPEFSRREPVEGCHGQMRVISFIEDQDVTKKDPPV
jgi:hypothetical protein